MKFTLNTLFVSFLIQLIGISTAKSQNKFDTVGNVGIGTKTPDALLEIKGGSTWTNASWAKSMKLGQGGAIQFNAGTQYFGIGGTAPNGLFFFSTNAEDASQPAQYRMVIKGTGDVGIGTITPQAQLDVQGTFRLGVGGGTGGLAYCIGYNRIGNAQVFGTTPEGLALGGDATGIDMAILPNGNVGIGTAYPRAKLAVKGTIFAEKIKVTLAAADWADYVFHKDYKLPTLQEVENYIQEHKHLPGIPDAKTVENNGLDVGEMNALLLKKVEELTLYMIEMNKQNQALATEVRELKKKIKN